MLWKCCTQYASKFEKLSSGHRTGKCPFFLPWKKSYDQPRQHIKKQRHYFAYKGPSSQSYVFSSSHLWMWELDYKEIWVPKNWCFWTVMLEKTLESPLDSQSWTSQSSRKSVLNILWKDWCWSWNSNTLATWCECQSQKKAMPKNVQTTTQLHSSHTLAK